MVSVLELAFRLVPPICLRLRLVPPDQLFYPYPGPIGRLDAYLLVFLRGLFFIIISGECFYLLFVYLGFMRSINIK